MESVASSKTAVYTSCFSDDYKIQLGKDYENLPDYHAISTSTAMLANRLSWFYNLRGPSVNLNAACASSIIAIDLAYQDLRAGNSKIASLKVSQRDDSSGNTMTSARGRLKSHTIT